MDNIIDLKLEHKTYRKGSSSITLLENFSLTVAEGEKLAIVGESGVGKSSLLNILGLIDRHYAGSYTLLGRSARELSDRESAAWRNQRIGFVLQESALINSLSIADNIKLPLLGRPAAAGQVGLRRWWIPSTSVPFCARNRSNAPVGKGRGPSLRGRSS